MADISMCDDKDCPMKDKCYRYTAPENPFRQTYFWSSPRKGNTCEEFWDNTGWPKDEKFQTKSK